MRPGIMLDVHHKQLDKAYEVIDQLAKAVPMHIMGETILFLKYALQGQKEKALQALPESSKRVAWMDFHLPWFMA